MPYSMTGFGRGEAPYGDGAAVVEVTTLNSRYLDVNCRGLREFGAVELAARARVAERLGRGNVSVTVTTRGAVPTGKRVVSDAALAKQYETEFDRLRRQLGLKGQLPLEALALHADLLRVEDEGVAVEAFTAAVTAALDAALDAVIATRATEGAGLARDLRVKISRLAALYDGIVERAPAVLANYRAKVKARAAELISAGDADAGRLEQEIALFAERCDVSEELVRSRVHVDAFEKALTSEERVGRRLDFIVVELNREANTVGSKAQDAAVASAVIEIKNLLEQIREQVQNLE